MKYTLIFLALCAAAQTKGQTTKVPLADVRPPASTTVTLVAYVNDAVSGKASIVPVVVSGAGAVLIPPTIPGGAYVIQIAGGGGGTQPVWANEVFTLTAATPTVQLATTPAQAFPAQVARNGLTLTSGADYTLSGSVITFLIGAVPGAGDILRVLYQR